MCDQVAVLEPVSEVLFKTGKVQEVIFNRGLNVEAYEAVRSFYR